MKPYEIIRSIANDQGRKFVWIADKLGISRQAFNMRCRDGNDHDIDHFIDTLAILGYELAVIPAGKRVNGAYTVEKQGHPYSKKGA